jgi:oligopeptide transport system substrate-binding protein
LIVTVLAVPAFAQTLRLSQRNEPVDLDPATATLPDEFFIIRALGEGLLAPDPAGGVPRPAAAERFEVSADGLTYTFHLRPDGRWSNGEPVTADDFVAAYRRLLTPATAAPKADLFFAVKNAREFVAGTLADFSAVGFRAAGAHTLVITLAQPSPRFPYYVASGPWIPAHPRVVAQHGRQWTQPAHHVGNGPFRLTEWRAQQRIVVQKNPRYRDAANVKLGEIQFLRFDSGDTEERAYRAGQIDLTMAVPQTKLETYARERPAELRQTPLAETRFLTFNLKRPPLDDPRVRRALGLAVDRRKLVERVTRGGQVPAFRFVSPALRGSAAAAPLPAEFRLDAAEARRLLAAAGFPGGKNFPRLELTAWSPSQLAVLEAIQAMWRQELGIEIAVAIQEAKVHLAALHAGGYDLAFVTTILDVADPAALLDDFTAKAANNFPHWRSTEFDALMDAARTDRDETHRTQLLARAENLLLESAPIAPLYFNTKNWLMRPAVHGWKEDALWARTYQDIYLNEK